MSLKWADGHDWMDCGTNGSPSLKYPGSLSTFQQVGAVAGRYSQGALNLINSAFGEMNFTRVFTLNDTWYAGRAVNPNSPLKTDYSTLWFRMEHGGPGGTVLALRYNPSAKVELMKGGNGTESSPGTVAGTVQTPLVTAGSYNFWELCVHQNGVNSAVKIFADDVLVLDLGPPLDGEGTGADGNIDLSAFGLIDRVTFRWESLGGGYIQDDYYVADNQGTVNNTRLGPIRIVSTIPVADITTNLQRNTGSSDASCVEDLPWPPGTNTFGAPDGNNTYLKTIVGNEQDLWTVSPYPCIAKILAVALNATVSQLHADQTSFLFGATTIGSASPSVDNVYEVLQVIQETSPLTGLGWVDGEINAGHWGVALSGGRITQYVIEKVLTLRNVPFTCGAVAGNSYSF